MSIRHFSVPVTLSILLLAPLPSLLWHLAQGGRPSVYRRGFISVAIAFCLIPAIRQYPWYMPYINLLGGNHAYEMMNDSNVDWNQGLFAVQDFVNRNHITRLPIDTYGVSEVQPIISQAFLWDCQAPTSLDAGQWAVISANMFYDGRNCAWLRQYPMQELAGGSMYAIRLPSPIPPDGAPGGPPLPAKRKPFLGEFGNSDMRSTLVLLEQRPDQIRPLVQNLMEGYQKIQTQQKKK